MKDFYYILGTDNKATPGEINAAYRKLAQKLQPAGQQHDHFIDSHFQDITEAYILLSDPVKRRKYDVAIKKHYQRRLYFFKIGHVNILTTLALILFTALFGYYVMQSIRGDKTKKVAAVSKAATLTKSKHRKKKRGNISKSVVQHKTKTEIPKITQPVFKPQPVIAKTTTVKVDTPALAAKPLPVAVRQAVIIPTTAPNTTIAIKANQTGMVYLHQTASYTSAVLANIPNSSQIQVLEKGPVFYKISYAGQTGYVPKWTVPTP